jgi:hypothetical protein
MCLGGDLDNYLVGKFLIEEYLLLTLIGILLNERIEELFVL